MPVYRPRTRLVNFRLSEDEYQLLKDTCARSGARSVSDYARAAVLSSPGTFPVLASPAPATSPVCTERWDRLEGLVQGIEAKMTMLVEKEQNANHG